MYTYLPTYIHTLKIHIYKYIHIYKHKRIYVCTKVVNKCTYFYVGMNHTMVTTTCVIDYPLYIHCLGYIISFCHILIHVCSKFKWRATGSNAHALTQVESSWISVKLPDIFRTSSN